MPRRRVIVIMAVIVGLLVPSASAAAHPVHYTPGAPGAGDPYFPDMGNGGYNVGHYDIQLAFNPTTHAIAATTTISARATQNLSRFDLDFLGALKISRMTVDGHWASFTRTGAQELVITPRHGLRDGRRFTVSVTYFGVPTRIDDPTLGISGWVATKDGAVALNQPFGAATYYPVNDSTRDKATYTQTVTVPNGLTVLANGEPAGVRTHAGKTTFRWRMTQPMSSELASIAIGRYTVTTGHIGPLPNMTAIRTALEKPGRDALFNSTTADIVKWESSIFGRFPFSSTGGLIDTVDVDYALEVQSRPAYAQSNSEVHDHLLAHELAHQWYGDSLTPVQWSDIWLNEGFATYAGWLWQQQFNGKPVQTSFDETYAATTDWSGKVADPGRDHIFNALVYERGAMTLHMLRKTIGDRIFFHLLRSWATTHRYGNVSTQEFIHFAEQISHRNLDAFFHTWVYSPGKPAI